MNNYNYKFMSGANINFKLYEHWNELGMNIKKSLDYRSQEIILMLELIQTSYQFVQWLLLVSYDQL